jgi:hypothetical protein
MEEIFANCIRECLSNYLFDNALFMAERFVAHLPCELSRNLLAHCYIRLNKFRKARISSSIEIPPKKQISITLSLFLSFENDSAQTLI